MSEGLEGILQSNEQANAFYDFLRDYFLSDKGIEIKTQFSKDMVINITALEVLNEVIKDEFGFKSKVIEQIIKRYKVNVINLDRKERPEVIEALKAVNPEMRDQAKQKTMLERVFGLR